MKRFNNSLNIAKFNLKRTWLSSAIWIIILLALTIFVAYTFTNIYGDPKDRVGMAETMKNPAMIAMVGPAYSENYTNGVMYSQMMTVFVIITIAIMNIFLIVKLTRKDEESSRLEVVRSLPVGRLSNLCGTMIVCVITNVVMALLTGICLCALNIESMNAAGSILYATTLGISGIFFGAITALFSQVTSTSRGAVAYSCIFLGVSYLVRAIGDVSVEALSLISPLGLPLRTQTYVNNYWWPVLVLFILTVIVTLFAFYLNSIRDLGAGLVAAKPGRKEASKFLQTPTGLAFRLLKSTLIGWGITIFLVGISYGSVFGDIEKFLEGSEMMQQIFLNNDKFTIAEQFMTTLMAITSIIVTLAVLLIILKIRSEEKRGRLDQIYSKKVSKVKLLFNYLCISVVASIVFQLFYAVGLWGSSYTVMEDPVAFLTIFKAAMYYLPAIWIMIGITVILIGYLPKFTSAIWGFLGLCFFTVYMGKLANLPDWFLKLIPFDNIPKIPVENDNITTLIILTLIALAMFIVGLVGYKRRDIISQ